MLNIVPRTAALLQTVGGVSWAVYCRHSAGKEQQTCGCRERTLFHYAQTVRLARAITFLSSERLHIKDGNITAPI